MDNELTIFGTPAQDTPFGTPISTPKRVPYRMNPVKMIRQHVPVKVLSAEEERIASPDSDSRSTSHSIKPMKTKRVKCTVQPSPTVNDGIGDQIIVHPVDRKSMHHSSTSPTVFSGRRDETLGKITLESAPQLESGKLSSHDEKPRTVCHSRGDAETIESNFSSQVAEVSSSMVQQKENEPAAATNALTNLNFFGETTSINARKSPDESIISHQKSSEEAVQNSSRFLPQDMANGSRSLSLGSERRETRLKEPETQKEIEITQKLLDAAASSFCDNLETGDKKKPTKPVIPPDKPKRALPPKKTVQIQENNTNASGGFKCDKKKFYDPSDIRKYMIKKKCERQAKEKEEKYKKANELAALKRKTEITKTFAHRSRIPLANNYSVKDVPDTTKSIKKSGSANKSRARSQPRESDALCYHQKIQKPANAETTVKSSHKVNPKSNKKLANADVPKLDDFAGIEETEKYFQRRFNDIISICAQEASKIVNAELQSNTDGDDVRFFKNSKEIGPSAVPPGEPMQGLSSSLEELRYKNPYNFLNILKGKVNLAQDDQRFHQQQDTELLVTPPKQTKLTPEELSANDKRRLSDETYILRHLNPELRLSDLNLSANKPSDTGGMSSERIAGHTFVVSEHEGRRKSAKTSKKMASKENLDTSMGMSGVQPLPPFKPFVTTPLTEKNSHNIPRILDFSDSKKTIPVRDSQISLSRTYSPDKFSEPLEQSKINRLEGNILSNVDLIHPNSDSLKVQNTSLLLPQSVHLNANTDCDIDQSKVLSVDKFNSLFNTDLTLTNIFMDDADSKIMDDFNISQGLSNETPQMNSSFVLVELYDQMIKSEDEKLLQILKKIQQQKEALNKHLRSEVFALEVQKNEYRDNKDEERIKTIKKKQRGILLKVTKSILELDKMKKSVIETVEKRKADLLRQKIAMKQKKVSPKQRSPLSKPHGRTSDLSNKTYLVTKQMKTFFGISSSSCTSIRMENGREVETNTIERNEQFNSEISDCIRHESNVMMPTSNEKNGSLKDSATSPIPFAGGISIRLDLNADKLLKLKNSFAEIQIHPLKSSENNELADTDRTQILQIEDGVVQDSNNTLEVTNTQDHKCVKIKRPLSPVILPPSKKILQIRRMSSSSDLTVPSLNDTTTTDQSDIELRISALQEQLRQRKLEAEKLRREEKQLRKEKLRSKEQSLLKQLEAYDDYIKKVSEMLTENVNLSEMKKPLIKQSSHSKPSANDSSFFEQSSFVERSPILTARAKQITRNDEKAVDEVETNTEDSEKQLRKADSGILIESEVTEPSETHDFKSKLHQLEIADGLPQASEPAEVPSKMDVDTSPKVSPSKNLLRMISDLHSEVHSLSEQLYSSDFVEDIPEDIADAKSEVSENVTSDHTSVSIEELLSDHHSDDVTPSHDDQKLVSAEEKIDQSDSHEDSISEDEIAESSSINASDPQSEFNIRVETIENLESISTESPVVIVEEQIPTRVESAIQNVEVSEPIQEKEVTINTSAKDETSSSAEFDFYNVKNVSDIESIGDLENGDQNQGLSDRDAPKSTLSVGEDIKSASSLENLSEQSKITSKFEASDENESKNSPELIKLDYVNESEGSNVADVNEPVEVFKEVPTMMDALSASDLSDTQPNSDNVRQNYNNGLTNLKTFFESKPADALANEKNETVPPEIKVDESAKVASPEEPHDTMESIVDNMEETDISESLEYDAMPVDTTNDTIPSILEDDLEKFSIFDAIAKSELLTLNIPSTKSSQEASREKDRSVEEHLVEDFSMPNLIESTFVVHNDSSSSNSNQEQPAESVSLSVVQEEVPSELEAPISDVDLEQITENQTPFLQALKRDQENLLARRQDSVDKITVDLFESLIEETCTSLVNTMSRKMRSCDFGLTPSCDHFDVNEMPEIDDKVSESLDKNKPVDDFDDDWYEKRLNLDQERLREAEELRLQQLKIEQEIEELQAQQHIPPYIYLREIPNKPPPPYTPPADQSSKIPTNEVELQDFVSSTIEYVCDELLKGRDIDSITELPDSKSAKKSKNNREVSTYKRFMFDLTKEIAKGIVENTKKTESLPWEESSRQKVQKPVPHKEELQKMIENEIQVLFGFQSKINKEKLIIQWSRKRKSDFVDDLLIQELQEEEGEWTNYEKDELIIKNQITETLLDDLLDDTVLCVTEAFRKKGFE